MFTSPKPGGGTTTMVLDLAHELGQLGLRTLAVEASARKSDPRYLAGSEPVASPAPAGLMAALLGHGEVDASIVPASGRSPDRLPLGPPPEDRRLPGMDRIGVVLQHLLTRYDLVLLDAAPLLLSADTELLVPRVEATVLVVEAGSVSRGEVKRAGHVLSRLDPAAVGAVLNRVRIYDGGGYFAELMQEYATGTKTQPVRWQTPWLWS
jgi:Mrp family chromosome partitioning ATPase